MKIFVLMTKCLSLHRDSSQNAAKRNKNGNGTGADQVHKDAWNR